jgi:hypothetical protein
VRLFTADRGREIPKEVWYLMGAWLLGATMNAMMTWWAITLTLLNHNFGNEVLSRDQLLYAVPIFVAVLVWLTRILFIGAFTVAGDRILDWRDDGERAEDKGKPVPYRASDQRSPARGLAPAPNFAPLSDEVPEFLRGRQATASSRTNGAKGPAAKATAPVIEPPAVAPPPTAIPKRDHSRVSRRPPIPNGSGNSRPNGLQARGRNR